MKYIVITWPDIQKYMDVPGFEEHSHLINDETGIEKFGSSAYFIDEEWFDRAEDYLFTKELSEEDSLTCPEAFDIHDCYDAIGGDWQG